MSEIIAIHCNFVAPERKAATVEELAGIVCGPLYKGNPLYNGTAYRPGTGGSTNNGYVGNDTVRYSIWCCGRRLTAELTRAGWERFVALLKQAGQGV